MTKQPGAKEYFDLHGSYEFKQLLHEYSGNYDSHSDLYSLLEGYAASKQLNAPTEHEINTEFRMIISHALLGYEDNVSREGWDLVMSECAKYASELMRNDFKRHQPI